MKLLTRNHKPGATVIATQGWQDMFFLHWIWPAARLAPLLPKGLVLDRLDGDAFLTIASSHTESMRPRGFPSCLGLSFDEVTVRTYVRGIGGRGMFFLDVESGSALASFVGRALFGLPVAHARVRHEVREGEIAYVCHRSNSSHQMAVRATPGTEAPHLPSTPLERFLLGRRSVFVAKNDGLHEVELRHPQLLVRPGTAVIEDASLLRAERLGPLPALRPIVHFADPVRVDTLAPQEVGAELHDLGAFRAHQRLANAI